MSPLSDPSPTLLHGEDAIGDCDIEQEDVVEVDSLLAADNLASRPGGLALIVRSLSSPSLSLLIPKLHSSASTIVLSGRPRPSRGGAT